MKRKDFTLAISALDGVSNLKGVKFAFSVLKNRKMLETQIEEDRHIFEEVLKPSDAFIEYEEKRIALCELHSEKDEEGNAITEGDRYKIIDTEKFNDELSQLTEEYNEAVEERKQQIQEYNTLMEEDIELEFMKVGLDDLPEEITETQLRKIEFMLDL